MTVDVRPTTAKDIEEFTGSLPRLRLQAYSAFEDGKLIAIGGVAYMGNGSLVLFLDCEEGSPGKYPITLVKSLKKLMKEVMAMGYRHIFASPELGEREPIARRFLEKMGFRSVVEGEYRHD